MRHFLQSDAWAGFQKAQNKKVFQETQKNWSFSAILEDSSSRLAKGKRLYAPYGPTAQSLEALNDALEALAEVSKKEKASYIRVEPIGEFSEKELKSKGLIKASRSFQPSQTWQIDLKNSKEEILKQMSSTNRNLFNTASKKGIKFEISYDQKKLSTFLSMIHNMSARTGMKPHSDKYFELMAKSLFPDKSAGLAIGYHENKPIVGGLFFDDKLAKTRYYAHAGSFDEARKLQANSPLLSYLIMNAKEKGMETFDFYGVSPESDNNHRWAGFSKFKRSFGGYEKQFNGTWELPVNKLNYRILSTSRKLAGKIKR
ncbi:MAG: peptidoglycan bridge formation glycyltransferase FemA/FemB family protein [Candidatus Saccharimonadales bacterium]